MAFSPLRRYEGVRILLISVLLLTGWMPGSAKVEHLLPRPQQITVPAKQKSFKLNRAVRLSDPTDCAVLKQFFEAHGGITDDVSAPWVTVEQVPVLPGTHDYELPGFPNEGYAMTVSSDHIRITVVTPTGTLRAAQTLAQLAEGYKKTPAIEALVMTDWPAFKVRGFMHDVGRSFISVDEIKKELDLLARFKVNVFHFHLTENQAWRFEVKRYPQLTSAASMTRFPGMYYTQEQCRDIERYARERGILVIPEIDMPGHSQAFERAMGHSMQTDAGVAELQHVLEEVTDVFAYSPYIHIGADEVHITYPGFVSIMKDKIHALGRKVMVWNPSGTTITRESGFDVTQLWAPAGQKDKGLPVEGLININSRYHYTNHHDVFADLIGTYKSNVFGRTQGSPEMAGVISATWNDRKLPAQEDILRQNNFYATVLAATSRAWMGGGRTYLDEGGTCLPGSGSEYEDFADWEARFLFHKVHSLKHEPIAYVRQANVHWRITDAFPNEGDADKIFPPETEGLQDNYVYQNRRYATGEATGAAVYLRHTWHGNLPSYYENPQRNTTAYAWTYVYSPKKQTVGALIEFQNYARSETDVAPEPGRWDRKGSRIWVNDEEVLPPLWQNTGKRINNEVLLMNENLTARPPVRLNLRKGWNKVLLKLPYNPNGLRLAKWMFTFVLTDTEGHSAVEGLVYSPDKQR